MICLERLRIFCNRKLNCRPFRALRKLNTENNRNLVNPIKVENIYGVFPDKTEWTVDTLLEPHDSKPYNPDIANVFYRAGFIENWGQGIQKICDECREIGAELPIYELLGTTLRVHFKALERALIDQPKVPKYQPDTLDDTLENNIIVLIKENPRITQDKLAEAAKVSVPSIKRAMKILSDSGKLVRKGGKRYGYWEVS